MYGYPSCRSRKITLGSNSQYNFRNTAYGKTLESTQIQPLKQPLSNL